MRNSIDPALMDRIGIASTGHKGADAVARSVVAAALLAHREGAATSYSRKKTFYTGMARYGGSDFGLKNVTSAVDHVAALGLVETTQGFWRSNGSGRQSTFTATDALVSAAGHAPRILNRPGELLILKDAQGDMIPYADTRQTMKLRADTMAWNESIASADIRLDAHDVQWVTDESVSIPYATKAGGPIRIDTASIALHRVYNGSRFSQGGRAYGHWCQGLPADRRAQIVIEGEPVALLDFSASHPRMLYAQAGIPMSGDPYTVAGFERDHAKVGLMVVLNAISRRQGVEAMAHKLATGPSVTAEDRVRAKALLHALETRHKPIAAAFYRGSGLACQRIEADILASVARECRKQGVVTLPVHDEMIVADRHAGRVRELMVSEWAKVLGFEGVVK